MDTFLTVYDPYISINLNLLEYFKFAGILSSICFFLNFFTNNTKTFSSDYSQIIYTGIF